MIRCVRLWTGVDNNSHFEEGMIALDHGARGDAFSGKLPVTAVSFQGRHWAEALNGTMRRRGNWSSR
jgi:hypothetical protein